MARGRGRVKGAVAVAYRCCCCLLVVIVMQMLCKDVTSCCDLKPSKHTPAHTHAFCPLHTQSHTQRLPRTHMLPLWQLHMSLSLHMHCPHLAAPSSAPSLSLLPRPLCPSLLAFCIIAYYTQFLFTTRICFSALLRYLWQVPLALLLKKNHSTLGQFKCPCLPATLLPL